MSSTEELKKNIQIILNSYAEVLILIDAYSEEAIEAFAERLETDIEDEFDVVSDTPLDAISDTPLNVLAIIIADSLYITKSKYESYAK